MLTNPLGIFLIAMLVYLIRDWRKKEKAQQAAKQWEDDNNAVKVAEWLDAEMCKVDPLWRQHADEDNAAEEAAKAARIATWRASHPEQVAAEEAAAAAEAARQPRVKL
jgi:hypothetical protein